MLYNTCFDDCQLELLLAKADTAQQRRDALSAVRVSHVYVQWSELDRYRSPGNYGYSPFVTRQLVRQELVERQQVLVPVPLGLDPERGELFAVVSKGDE